MTSAIKLMRSDPKAMAAIENWRGHYFQCPLCQSAHTKLKAQPSGCTEGDRLRAVSDKVGRWLARDAG